ncbi:malto-oligosyltrehalose trehalohydrolase [Georgenia faecalis]|uniref:Malto-oligosyltrehalose trehalohydrolase n=1 Tax=Georgenia faecalis TaxID=2483799 RepID=A0ABV9DE14_9MICO|nr:malto-oligosyltrehalose trehalohydrolase [Georgenia faecalis]
MTTTATAHRPDQSGTAPLRVWAPAARTVELDVAGERTPMRAEDGGWWASAPVAAGTDYAFRLDGGDPRPDPRSPWQPAGVHGPSRAFDPTEHAWSDGDWAGRSSLGAVIYELHVGTFTPEGTLDAAVERLDHLAALGVDMVELMPVAAFPGQRGWGYDGVALYAVHEAYGGPAALQRFVDAAHARGLAVCLDVVYNHLGPSGNYLGEFGPYFTDRHETPWGAAVNLDGPDAGPVRAFIVDNALRWMRDFHIDALRLDAVHALIDDSERHILAELSDAVAALEASVGRPLSLIAESDLNDAVMITPTDQGGRGMTAQWDDDVHHALHAFLTGERHGYYVSFGPAQVLRKALTDVFVHDGEFSEFRDQVWGSPVPADVDTRRFVVFASDHDQVGNRAVGDRPTRVLDGGQLAISAAVVLLGPYTPMLFMGEEWGARTPFQYFTDHTEPELGAAVSEGRAREFGSHGWAELYGGEIEVPDPQALVTFEESRLDWAEPDSPDHARLLTWYRDLVALRRAEPDVDSGRRAAVDVAEDESWLVMDRGSLAVVVNASDAPQDVPVPREATEVLLAWEPATAGGRTVRLPGHGVAIVRLA